MIPLLIGVTLSAVLATVDWFGFWFIFAPIGASVSLGFLLVEGWELGIGI